MDAVVDRFVVEPEAREGDQGGDRRALLVGDGLMQVARRGAAKADASASTTALCSPTHHFVYGDIEPEYFVFNNPESACRTCGGLGVDKLTHPELLVPDPKRSIVGGCFVREAFKYNPDTWDGRVMYSLVAGARASRSTRRGRSCRRRRATRSSTASTKKIALTSPPEAKVGREQVGRAGGGFGGIARRIERYYRRYRQRGEASSRMEAWLDKVMVEHTCPDCEGARLRADAAAVHHRRQDDPRRRAAPLRRAARLPRHDQAGGPRRRRRPPGAQGDPRPARAAARHRPRLSELQPPLGHALGRRVAAHPPVDADRLGADGHALRARRAEHRPASRRTTSR